MRLLNVAILHSFGGNAKHPRLSASIRLTALAVSSMACGFALSLAAGRLPIAAMPDTMHIFATATLSTQAVVAVTLLMASGALVRIYRGTFARLLWLLPLRAPTRWLTLLLPSITLTILTVLLMLWPLGALWQQLGLSHIAIGVSMLAGAGSALGLVHSLPHRLTGVRFLYVPLVLYTEYMLVHTSALPSTLPLIYLAGIILLLIGTWPLSSYLIRTDIQHIPKTTVRVRSMLPNSWWFGKKVLRAAPMRLSLVAGFVLSSLIAFLGTHYALGADTVAMGTAILMASCAADMRGLCTRYVPPEITALRGTKHFFGQHCITTILLCSFVAAPLLWHTQEVSLSLIAPLLTGMAAGLYAGNLAIPRPHDISSQVLAGLLCIIPLFLIPAMPVFPDDPLVRAWAYMGIVAFFMCAAFGIEYKRNTYVWRNT